MATEVRHGLHPKFRIPLLPGRRYTVTVEGRYTRKDGWAAGGVTRFRFHGTGGVKRLAELLALRTCFLEWYMEQWERTGGKRSDGIRQIRQYPFHRVYVRRRRSRRARSGWWAWWRCGILGHFWTWNHQRCGK